MNAINNKEYEINLSVLTLFEQYQFGETFNLYRNEVIGLAKNKGLYTHEPMDFNLLEHELDARSKNTVKAMDTALLTYPHIVKCLLKKAISGIRKDFSVHLPDCQVYIDLSVDYSLIPSDFYYDKFFIRKLRSLNLTKVPTFLNYQLITHYKNDLPYFINFVRLAIEEHTTELLDAKKIKIYYELLSELKITEPKCDTLKRLSIKRTANDRLTALNLEQTVLMIALLQKEKFILSDEILSDSAIADLFEGLTGYSCNTIRQSLGKYPLLITNHHSKALKSFLTNLSKNVK